MTDAWPSSIVLFRPFIWARFRTRGSVSPKVSQAFFAESRVILDEISHNLRIPSGSMYVIVGRFDVSLFHLTAIPWTY